MRFEWLDQAIEETELSGRAQAGLELARRMREHGWTLARAVDELGAGAMDRRAREAAVRRGRRLVAQAQAEIACGESRSCLCGCDLPLPLSATARRRYATATCRDRAYRGRLREGRRFDADSTHPGRP